MTDEPPPQISILDARLAEIDRRLRTIQTGLADDGGPAPASPERRAPVVELPPRVRVPEPGAGQPPAATQPVSAPSGGAGTPAALLSELRTLASAHERILAVLRESLAGYEHSLTPTPAPATAAGQTPGAGVTLTAGPFLSTDAVRDFERALRALPGVGDVELRGFEGGDRAVVDVRLKSTS